MLNTLQQAVKGRAHCIVLSADGSRIVRVIKNGAQRIYDAPYDDPSARIRLTPFGEKILRERLTRAQRVAATHSRPITLGEKQPCVK